MQFECKWPKDLLTEKQLVSLITKPDGPTDGWEFHPCEIINSYDNYLDAHLGRKCRLTNPTYVTDKELGTGHRKKRKNTKFHDKSDEETPKKKKVKTSVPEQRIPSPPAIVLATKQDCQVSSGKAPVLVSQSTVNIRLTENKKTLNVCRKNRGSKAENLNDLKKIMEAKLKSKETVSAKKMSTTPSVKDVPHSSKDKEKSDGEEDEDELSDSDEEKSSATNRDKDKSSDSDSSVDGPNSRKQDSKKSNIFDSDSCSDDSDEQTPQSASKEDDDVRSLSPPTDTMGENLGPFGNSSPSPTSQNVIAENITDGGELDKRTPPAATSLNCVSDEIFKMKVLRLLSELNQKTETCLATTTRLALHTLPNEKAITRPAGLPIFPLKTLSEIETTEKILEKSDDNIANLSIYLSSFVFKDPEKERKSATNVMEELMWNCCAKFYSMNGKKGKKSLSNLHMWKAVKGAISWKVDGSDLSETKAAVQSWLKYAGYRTQEDGSPKLQDKNKTQEDGSEKKRAKNKLAKSRKNKSKRRPVD